MGLATENNVRAYLLKDRTLVCPVCATDEEREDLAEQGNYIAEDEIHDDNPIFCVRCKKKIQQRLLEGAFIIVIAELPGIKKEDGDITLTDDTISISGEKNKEEEVNR